VAYLPILAAAVAAPAGANAATIMAYVRARLLQPRRSLSFTFNGQQLIPQPQTGLAGTVDAKNGPRPIDCIVVDLANQTFLLTYSIEAYYWENNGATIPVKNAPGRSILYNRWSETVDIDYKNYTTKRRSGKFIIRSDNIGGNLADQFRNQMCVLGVIPGFVRESSSYTVDPSGLGIAYTIVDKEYFKPPPTPAFRASGKYIEETGKGGVARFGSCNLHLEGDKVTSQSLLVKTAIAIVSSKLTLNGADIVKDGIKIGFGYMMLLSAKLEVDMYENIVDFYMRVQMPMARSRVKGINAYVGIITGTPYTEAGDGGNPFANTPDYLLRGTANILLQAAKYYDPSLGATALGASDAPKAVNALIPVGANVSNQLNAGVSVGRAGVTKEP
jgi:hypothetical protein